MGQVAKFFEWIKKNVPVVVAKIGTFLLLIFTLGLFVGFFLGSNYFSPVVLWIPVAAMFVMWHKLDIGVFILLFLIILALFFPEFWSFFI